MQEWTTDDVAEWLTNIGLTDYIDIFTTNHITGQTLLELTEKDIKDDLGISSVGHRKSFEKSIANLKKLNCKNKTYNSSIRTKLLAFYEKNKNNLRSNHNSINSLHNNFQKLSHLDHLDSKFNSYLFSLGNHEIIEENQSEGSVGEFQNENHELLKRAELKKNKSENEKNRKEKNDDDMEADDETDPKSNNNPENKEFNSGFKRKRKNTLDTQSLEEKR